MIEALESRTFLSASVAKGTLTVTGTDLADRIAIVQKKKSLFVREGTQVTRFGPKDQIRKVVVIAGGGDDHISVSGRLGVTVAGGDGNDLIEGGAGADLLSGGNGDDRILGNAGNDSLVGGDGQDVLLGGAGDDIISAHDGQADQVSGGRGNDKARVDDIDTAWNIEVYFGSELGFTGLPSENVPPVPCDLVHTTPHSPSCTTSADPDDVFGNFTPIDITGWLGSADSEVHVNSGKLILDAGGGTTLGGSGSVSGAVHVVGSGIAGDYVLIDYNNAPLGEGLSFLTLNPNPLLDSFTPSAPDQIIVLSLESPIP